MSGETERHRKLRQNWLEVTCCLPNGRSVLLNVSGSQGNETTLIYDLLNLNLRFAICQITCFVRFQILNDRGCYSKHVVNLLFSGVRHLSKNRKIRLNFGFQNRNLSLIYDFQNRNLSLICDFVRKTMPQPSEVSGTMVNHHPRPHF